MADSSVLIRFQGVENLGKLWGVTFTWGTSEKSWLTATVEVEKSAKDEEIIRIARAKFFAMISAVREHSARWELEQDLWKALEKGA
ncbi:hypothetical protein OE766_03475 [Pararhizobium sp. YC-54]|uniref:hypothetical protein n=1 Tax=Pararhizobium sp. YC-54 TaxID=2986920 RepID=UPI0021F6B6EF|nr:hypothetical protein [Pararhizobium sp. YC-54]MCV9997298.1 hypothetical protein [Pararhizobium sp. YC-54]